MKRIVIDASASLKWIFEDEKDSDFALMILSDLASGDLEIISPTIWLYETTNSIKSAILRKRINLVKGKRLLSDILKVAPEFFDFLPIVTRTFEIANKYEISVYDAAYVVVAQREKLEFYTGDETLHKKLKKLKFVKLVSRY